MLAKVRSVKNLHRGAIAGHKDSVGFVLIDIPAASFVCFLREYCLIDGTPRARSRPGGRETEFVCQPESSGEEG